MKKQLFLAVLFLLPIITIAQTTKPIDGFLGIKFGSSKAAVLAAMKAKGAIFDKKNSDNDFFSFSNVKLGTRKPSVFAVKFISDKSYEADFLFSSDVEPQVFSIYKDLSKDLSDVYSEGKVTEFYNSPYEKTDNQSDKIVGLKSGKIDFHTVWTDAKENTIAISIDTDLEVLLVYQDGELFKQVTAKEGAKNKSDL